MFNAFMGLIRGRVQGVGYRYFAKNKADELDLTGWVKNLPDGAVEIFAAGPRTPLEQFMQRLKEGPLGSRVESADFQWVQSTDDFKKFEIRF